MSQRDTNKGRMTVICSEGKPQRFLRGVITHDLVQRGLTFDDAYTVARAVRGRLADRQEVETREIGELVAEIVEARFGSEWVDRLSRPVPQERRLLVDGDDDRSPFSRGVLARSIYAAGLDLDRAYRHALELETQLHHEGIAQLSSAEIVRRVGDLLETSEGPGIAGRYRLVRRLHRLPRPMAIYIGGASGAGKSTLALELAPLLRISRINATDTIRQVMRMVFSPAILPALHTSSFEVPLRGTEEELSLEPPLRPGDPEALRRLLDSFGEQSTRVCVGVRAVVERSLAENMSILVEGVHLIPGLVPFADLEGLAYQIPMMLATLDAEQHRMRFLGRSRHSTRRAERYVERFTAIRGIQDHLLEEAELHDVPLLDTSDGEPPIFDSLRLVTGMLEQRLPYLTSATEMATEPTPLLLIAMDGMPDRPVRALGGRTPLQAADTPNLDRLAEEGICGLADPVSPGVVPDTAAGTLALFGQSPLAMSRGPVEALGADLKLGPSDVALRANLATFDDKGLVIDRRAGRIRQHAAELVKALDRIVLPASLAEDVEIRVAAATEHRLAIVLRGEGLSSAIQGSDPGDAAIPGPPQIPHAQNPMNESAVRTARVLAVFEQKAQKVLASHPVNKKRKKKGLPEANGVITRGPGRAHRLVAPEYQDVPLRMACISGDRTILGIARWLGAVVVSEPEMTANLDTDLAAKFRASAKALRGNDLVVLHIKGADIAAHDQRPELKVAFLETFDEALGKFLDSANGPLRVAVAADHATLSETGQHAADPLPVLIWGSGVEADDVQAFDETSCASGALHRFPLQLLLERAFEGSKSPS